MITLLLGYSASAAVGGEIYVAMTGEDTNPGTMKRPLRSLGRAAQLMTAGDTCFVRQGVYRDSFTIRQGGQRGKPIRFVAYPGEMVTLAGTEPVPGKWQRFRGSIYRIRVEHKFDQLFVDGRMMIEARWPNATFQQMLDRSRWAHACRGSRYGLLRDPELAKTGVDWTGALATLNVTHQFYTWTRTVARHQVGQEAFEYARDFGAQIEMRYGKKTTPWEDDRYYLSGKLEALDLPGEWYLDRAAKTLYLWTKEGDDPASHRVEFKARDLAVEGAGVDYVQLHGFHFFAATFALRGCNHCVIDGCHLLFPTYTRELAELNAPPHRHATPRTEMIGDYNVFRNSSLAYTPIGGVVMSGRQNLVENNLIHDICWCGSLRYVAIAMNPGSATSTVPPGGTVRGNSVYRCGNAIINYRGQPYVIERNHVFDGGMACKDVAIVYTGQPSCAGSEVRYNWVHGCWTEEGNGLGIRGDDQTRRLTVHHNVVWDCGRDGIIVKGDENRVVNNTCLYIGARRQLGNYIALPTRAEPKKPWRNQHPLLSVQNQHSLIANNAARTISGNQGARTPFPFADCLSHNYQGDKLGLIAPEHWDFRPRADSPLVDAGAPVHGIAEVFHGAAPDIGAYEAGGDPWQPGHHNGIWVGLPSGSAAARILPIALTMPVRSTVQLRVTPTAAASSVVCRFTPTDWMRPRNVNVPRSIAGARGIRIDGPWGIVQLDVPIEREQIVWFPDPDLGKPEPLATRFDSWLSESERQQREILAQLEQLRQRGKALDLIVHGDFESTDMKPWSRASNGRKTPDAMRIERVRRGTDGGWCVQIECADAELMKNGVLKWLHPLPRTLQSGIYVLSYDLRVDDLQPRDPSGMFCSYIRTTTPSGGGANVGQRENAVHEHHIDWTHRDCVIEIPAGARPSFVSLQLHKATGSVYVDNVKLWRVR